jgi:hypothetical protein
MMLGLMFIGPLAVGLFFVINILINKFKQNTMFTNIFKILRIISVLLSVTLSVFLIYLFVQQNSPNERFKSLIINPIPESVKNIKRGGRLNAMGSSSFFITFEISPTDFEKIIHSQKFSKFHQNDAINPTGRMPELYKETIYRAKKYMNDVSEMYIFDEPNSKYRFNSLIINKKHTMVYYSST